jgi:hypothetical protein
VLFGAGEVNGPGNGWGGRTWGLRDRTWTNLTPNLPVSPARRAMAGFVHDPQDGDAILFGGTGACNNFTACNDTWAFNGTGWSQLHPATSPPRLWRFGIAYDRADREIVLFGGTAYSGPALPHDTWTFAGGTWIDATRPSAPGGRVDAPLAYDPATKSVLLYGGLVPGSGANNSTWSFHGGVWTRLHSSPTPPRLSAALMGYDAALGKVVLYGGADSRGGLSYSTWAYSGGSWTNLTPTLSPFAARPGPLGLGVYDGALGEFLILGPTGFWALH